VIAVTDRTRIEYDWRCSRMRWWLTEYGGTGIVPATPHHALTYGIAVHDGLYYLGKYGLDEAIERTLQHEDYKLLSDDRQESVLGLLYAFGTRVWPQWMEDYTVVGLEQELEFEDDGVLYMCRPDVVLRSKVDGTLWYPDFKTFARWSNRKWNYALQQQLTLLAIERSVGEPVAGAWIQGLNKGSQRNGEKRKREEWGTRIPRRAGGMGQTAWTRGDCQVFPSYCTLLPQRQDDEGVPRTTNPT
jgi:hypothetical protein